MSEIVIPAKIDIVEILKVLPHRYPFVMVDRILSLELGQEIVGLNVPQSAQCPYRNDSAFASRRTCDKFSKWHYATGF